MPVYNGERFIRQALSSLLRQDCRNWRLIISDNSSTDDSALIAQDFVRQDSRIQLVQQPHNMGARENFLTVARSATTPYFMWAAADDEWSENYISACRERLLTCRDVGFVSGSIVNTNESGGSVRAYDLFPNFELSKKLQRLDGFLSSREVDGKANLFYAVYRTSLVQEICALPNIFEGWGCDMGFVAAALARTRYIQVPQAVLYKRLANKMEVANQELIATGSYAQTQFQGHYPLSVHSEYVQALCAGMRPKPLKYYVLYKMQQRKISRQFKQLVSCWCQKICHWIKLLVRKCRNF
jgi:glycosyltransferase involved in cell wall biosynthesis